MALVLTSRHKVTYAQLSAWPDDGRRYELYDGEVSEVPAHLPRHQLALQALYDQLRAHVAKADGLVLISPIDIVFDETNVLQPDIVVFTAARAGLIDLDKVIRVPPDVAIEVISPSTERNDRGRKLGMFERFGVAEYWILDPVQQRMEFRTFGGGRNVPPTCTGVGDAFHSNVLTGFACDVASLFPWRATNS